MEAWIDIYKAAINRTSPWLGHDPFPSFEYTADTVKVWSDDYSGTMNNEMSAEEIGAMFYIQYERNELIAMLTSIRTDLLDFYNHAFEQTFHMVNDKLKKKLFTKYCKWFNLEENK